ncbi:hypothetical protein BG005_006202 [Podila minutissima]|nr:hypothetical protein BG005_006202 [Podila minutissima]
MDAIISGKHITYSPALHPFTLTDVDDNDSKGNSYATRSVSLPSLVHPVPKLACICLDFSEIHYHGSLAEFHHDHELNTVIRHIQTALIATSSCRNSNHDNTSSSTTTTFCCVDCSRHASRALWALLDQHRLLKPTLTVIWEDDRWCCLEGRVLYALTQLRWRGPVQVQVLLNQKQTKSEDDKLSGEQS